jgi:hypothetical protein
MHDNNDEACRSIGSVPGEYICGQDLSNPNMDITSFDNVLFAAILVWQVITLEGWTYIMYITVRTTS